GRGPAEAAGRLAAAGRNDLQEQAARAREEAGDLPLFYTEWGASSEPGNPLHDEPWAAAFAVRSVMEAAGLVECYAWWTFSDLFEEEFLSPVPFHGGFGLLTIHGIPKPAYRAFELL